MMRPKNHMRFDLTQETDLYRRLGLHGLYRLLAYGEEDEHFPGVRQTETCQWEIDEDANTIDLWYDSQDDLVVLMNNQWGDFRHGIAVNPGYETNPDKDGAYVTVRFHQATAGRFFFGMTGPRRSGSMSKDKDKGRAEINHLQKVLGNGETTPLVMGYTRHNANPLMKIGKHFSAAVHPALSQWNYSSITATPEDYFLISFACLSYIYTMSSEDLVGMGIDRPTFVQAATVHDHWRFIGGDGAARNVLWVSGGVRAALWVMASALDLEGTFSALYKKGDTGHLLFNTRLPNDRTVQLFEMVRSFQCAQDKNGKIRGTYSIPVRMKSSTEVHETALDRIVFNLENGLRWFLGLDETLYQTERGVKGLYRSESDLYTLIFQGDPDMDDIEREVGRKFNHIFYTLARKYARDAGREKPQDKDHEKARKRITRTYLARASTTDSLLDAVASIKDESGWDGTFTADEGAYILMKARSNPMELRSFLNLSLNIRFNQTTAESLAQRANNTNDDSPPTVSL